MKKLILVALIAPLFLSGCVTPSRQSVVEKQLANIPQSLKQACDIPVDLPDRSLSSSDVSRLWAKDRGALADCAVRHGALSRSVEELTNGRK